MTQRLFKPPLSVFDALKNKSFSTAEGLLLTDCDLLNVLDAKGRNVVHYAAQYADREFIHFVCRFAQREKRENLLYHADIDGITPLHVAAEYNSYLVVADLLIYLNVNADNNAKQVTNKGKLPIDLVESNPNSNDAYKICLKLAWHMSENDLPVPGTKIDLNDVLRKYKTDCHEHPELKKILTTLVQSLNECSDLYCETNPKSILPESKDFNLHVEIEKMRNNKLKTMHRIHKEFVDSLPQDSKINVTDETIKMYIRKELERNKRICDHYAAVCQDDKVHKRSQPVGNCGEHADVLQKIIFDNDPELATEPAVIYGSDHCIIASNRRLTDKLMQFDRPVVFADKLRMRICLAREFWQEMCYYRFYYNEKWKLAVHVYGPLNPRFHGTYPLFCYHQSLSYHSSMQKVFNLDNEKLKQFFDITYEHNKTEFHYLAGIGDPLRIKIYFHFLTKLKDTKTAKEILQRKTNYHDLSVLDYVAYNENPGSITAFFDEFNKFFKEDKLLEVQLFGPKHDRIVFLSCACACRNPHAINEVFNRFLHLKQIFITMLQRIFMDYLKDDIKISALQIEFLKKHYAEYLPDQATPVQVVNDSKMRLS